MLKKNFLFIFLLLPVAVSGQNFNYELSKNDDIISNFLHLSPRQLFDTAKYYQDKNVVDTALIIYNMLINTHVKDANSDQQLTIIKALNNSAVIYNSMYDYPKSYKSLIDALQLSENINNITYTSAVYCNIGHIYFHLKKFDMAKHYFSKALNITQDSVAFVLILSNLGSTELEVENLDSAYYILNNASQINKRHYSINSIITINNNIAFYYQKRKCYDSAHYYYQLSL